MQDSEVTQPVKLLANETPLLVIHTYILYCYLPKGLFRDNDYLRALVLNGLQFSNILICDICPNIRTVVHFAEDRGMYYG